MYSVLLTAGQVLSLAQERIWEPGNGTSDGHVEHRTVFMVAYCFLGSAKWLAGCAVAPPPFWRICNLCWSVMDGYSQLTIDSACQSHREESLFLHLSLHIWWNNTDTLGKGWKNWFDVKGKKRLYCRDWNLKASSRDSTIAHFRVQAESCLPTIVFRRGTGIGLIPWHGRSVVYSHLSKTKQFLQLVDCVFRAEDGMTNNARIVENLMVIPPWQGLQIKSIIR